MKDIIFYKRNWNLLWLVGICALIFLLILPNLSYTVLSKGGTKIKPGSLFLAEIIVGGVGLSTLILFLVNYQKYKISSNKLYKWVEIKKLQNAEYDWKEVKD